MIVFILFFIIIFLFTFLYYGQDYKFRKQCTGIGNRGYNGCYTTYTYHVPHTPKEIAEILSHKNVGDLLYYEFDSSKMEIVFANPEADFYQSMNAGITFQIHFEEKETSCLLLVEQKSIGFSNNTNRTATRMDAFWMKKVDAVPCTKA